MIKALALTFLLVLLSGCAALKGFDTQKDFDRGVALFNQGRFEAAIPHFQSVTRDDPDFAPAYFYLGRSYISLSRWRSAIQPLRTAFRLAPAKARSEIMTVLTDAMFAAAINDFRLGGKGASPERLPPETEEELL